MGVLAVQILPIAQQGSHFIGLPIDIGGDEFIRPHPGNRVRCILQFFLGKINHRLQAAGLNYV